MKKIILLLVLFFGIAQEGFCDVTYSAKSTVKTDNNAEVIQLDVRPIVDLTNHGGIGPDVRPTPAYVAPLILPSNEGNPTLNFNLNNVKNLKKGGTIFPDENVNRTITSVVQYFPYSYDKVYSHLLGIVDASDLEVVSYDSNTGRIFANYKKEKPIYITVSKYNNASVMVKITPADGIYNIPANVTDKIYSELNKSLSAK